MLKRLIRELFINLLPLCVAILGWGDVRSFFAHGSRLVWAFAAVVASFGTYFSKSERINRGVRRVPGQTRTLLLLEAGTYFFWWLVPFCDRHNLFVFPNSDALRYAGLLLYALGKGLRVWAFVYLGRYFSIFLTVQKDHRLVTDNIYKRVRHPSYAGLLLLELGFCLLFRSLVGLCGWLLLLAFFVRRMNREERVLAEEFGAEWQRYRARTRRLLPGIY